LAYKTAKKNSTQRRIQRKGAKAQGRKGKDRKNSTPRRIQRKGAKAQGRKGKDRKIGHGFRSKADFPHPLIPIPLFP
jgi:hypothetical protein